MRGVEGRQGACDMSWLPNGVTQSLEIALEP